MQFSPLVLVGTTLLNLKKDGKILNIPLYVLSLLSEMLKEKIETDKPID
jgi:hypothetical protein